MPDRDDFRTPNALELFVFPATAQQVRVEMVDDEPRFVAADVCAVLGLTNVTEALRGLEDDEFSTTEVVDSAGRRQRGYIVTEAGLYSLILRSRKPEAKAFKRWLTHEVLPTLRRTGRYVAAPEPRMPSHPEALRGWASALDRIAELEPDAAMARRTIGADGMSLVGTVAKRFGIKERALREFLYAERLLIRVGNRRNEPYAQHIESGHFALKTRLVDVNPDRAPEERSTTFVTPKGEGLIWKRLYAAGLVSSPTMPLQLQLT